jgi:cell division septation protein DedD
VMVGRGVRADRGAVAEADTLTSPPAGPLAENKGTQAPPAGAIPPVPPPSAQGQAVNDELSYYKRLEAPGSPKETLKPAPTDTGAPAAGAQTKPAVSPPPSAAKQAAPLSGSAPRNVTPQETKPPATRGTTTAKAAVEPPKTTAKASVEPSKTGTPQSAEPAGGLFTVQVGAMRTRAAADAFVKELSAKGYDAYVVAPSVGSSLHRVRVGKFKDRRDADELRRQLEKENYQPLIIR